MRVLHARDVGCFGEGDGVGDLSGLFGAGDLFDVRANIFPAGVAVVGENEHFSAECFDILIGVEEVHGVGDEDEDGDGNVEGEVVGVGVGCPVFRGGDKLVGVGFGVVERF